MEVKHGGCYDCGTKNQEILKSVTAFRGGKVVSVGLCDICFKKEQMSKDKI